MNTHSSCNCSKPAGKESPFGMLCPEIPEEKDNVTCTYVYTATEEI